MLQQQSTPAPLWTRGRTYPRTSWPCPRSPARADRGPFLQAVERGQIGAEQNLDVLMDIVFGAMWFRLLTGHDAMDESFADELTQVIITLGSAAPQRR